MSIMSTLKQKHTLHTIEMLLCCSSPNHKDCVRLQTALMKNFKNVLASWLTRVNMEGVEYCIGAHGLLQGNERSKFEKELDNLKYSKTKTVRDVKLFVSVED